MEQSEKRTDSNNSGIRKASRVVDVSWAADYLDDAWENEHSAQGAYDTQVLPPLTRYSQTKKAESAPKTATQQFKAAAESWGRAAVPATTISGQEETQRVREAASREPVQEDYAVDEPGNDTELLWDEDYQIRDAVTDQAMASMEDLTGDEPEEELKIRDAVTNQTMASVGDARQVRKAILLHGMDEDLDELSGLRDARSSHRLSDEGRETTGFADTEVSDAMGGGISAPAFLTEQEATDSPQQDLHMPAFFSSYDSAPKGSEPTEKLVSQESAGKTIVASKEVLSIRQAANDQKMASKTDRFNLEELFREDENDFEAEEEIYDAYEEDDDNPEPDYNDYRRDSYRETGYDDYDDDGYDDREYDDRSYRSGGYRDDGYRTGYGSGDSGRNRNMPRSSRGDSRRSGYSDDSGNGAGYASGGQRYYEYVPSRNPLRFIPLVLVIALCVFGFIAAKQICHDVPLNASDYSKVKYTVVEGLTNDQLSKDLESMGIIDNPLVFRLRCLFYDADYVPGTYELSPCYSTEKIINILSGYTYGTED